MSDDGLRLPPIDIASASLEIHRLPLPAVKGKRAVHNRAERRAILKRIKAHRAGCSWCHHGTPCGWSP